LIKKLGQIISQSKEGTAYYFLYNFLKNTKQYFVCYPMGNISYVPQICLQVTKTILIACIE